MASRTPFTLPGLAIASLVLGLIAAASWADVDLDIKSQARLKEDVGFLAADAQEGRSPGSKGIEASADYIAAAFKEAGLKPAPGADGYFQPFAITGEAYLPSPPKLTFKGPGDQAIEVVPADMSPLAIGSSGDFDGIPIVFAGYGITGKDESKKLDYDDYAGVDVKGKAVLIIRREPQMDDENSPFSGKQTTRFASGNHKATNAFQHGAAAILMVNDHAGLKDLGDVLARTNALGSDQNSPIPFVMITRAQADKLLLAAGQPKLESLEKDIDADLKPRTRTLEGWMLGGSIKVERRKTMTKNVVGVLEGAGPTADETIVVGGHYDHLGRGELGSLAFFSKSIHNGADDNASGTATVMELARRLGKRSEPLPRRIVFMAFSGEEKGLLGSQHYVEHPLIPLDKTVMMFNFDMVGRLNKDELTLFGLGSSTGLEGLANSMGKEGGFTIKPVRGMSDGIGGSDHESFYPKKMPVLFFFTGVHKDYHRPTDDSDLINYAGMERIANLGEKILLDIARRPVRPDYVKVVDASNPHGGGGGGGGEMRASLGTMPDYGAPDKGVKLADVRDGSPAQKAGIKGGDVIVGFAGKPISSVYDYTDSLSRAKPGDVVDVLIKRDGKEMTIKVTLGARPGQ